MHCELSTAKRSYSFWDLFSQEEYRGQTFLSIVENLIWARKNDILSPFYLLYDTQTKVLNKNQYENNISLEVTKKNLV